MKRAKPRCPACGKTVSADNLFFPFCSDRCRLLDLGEWLSGKYCIKGREAPQTETEVEE
jgi:uncharacterized protein